MRIEDVFKTKKPIIGVLHNKGKNEEEILQIAKQEIKDYVENGVNGIIVENYFGDEKAAEMVLSYMSQQKDLIYGIGLLGFEQLSFDLAKKYHAHFIQIDSITSHLAPVDDIAYGKFIEANRKTCNAFLFGGVRFKYQPYLSGRSLEEDLKIGMERCDAICVTQDRTGQETDISKIKEYRSIIKDFPLIVAAGMTPDNCAEQLAIADGGVVGSYFKDTYQDTGTVDKSHVKYFMDKVKAVR